MSKLNNMAEQELPRFVAGIYDQFDPAHDGMHVGIELSFSDGGSSTLNVLLLASEVLNVNYSGNNDIKKIIAPLATSTPYGTSLTIYGNSTLSDFLCYSVTTLGIAGSFLSINGNPALSTVDLSSLAVIPYGSGAKSQLAIYSNTSLAKVDLSALTDVHGTLTVYSNSALSALVLDLSSLATLDGDLAIYLNSGSSTVIDLSNLTTLGGGSTVNINSNLGLTTNPLAALTAIPGGVTFSFYSNTWLAGTFTANLFPALTSLGNGSVITLQDNGLNGASVDATLLALYNASVASGANSGSVDISGASNAAPTPNVAAVITILIASGALVNGEYLLIPRLDSPGDAPEDYIAFYFGVPPGLPNLYELPDPGPSGIATAIMGWINDSLPSYGWIADTDGSTFVRLTANSSYLGPTGVVPIRIVLGDPTSHLFYGTTGTDGAWGGAHIVTQLQGRGHTVTTS